MVIALAEMGDKTQLVCMTLAVRHRGLPIFVGAVAAFAVLNALAVAVGSALGTWVPERVLAGVVAVLFALFGLYALRRGADGDEVVEERAGGSVLVAAFLLILLSELGDKTQLAVAGLSSAANAVAVWVGATLALAATSAMAVVAGRTVLQRVPIVLLHRLSGVVFLGLAAYALSRVFTG